MQNTRVIKKKFDDVWIGPPAVKRMLINLYEDSLKFRVDASHWFLYYVVTQCHQLDVFTEFKRRFADPHYKAARDDIKLDFFRLNLAMVTRLFRVQWGNSEGTDFYTLHSGVDFPLINRRSQNYKQLVWNNSQARFANNPLLDRVIQQIALEYHTDLKNHVKLNFFKCLKLWMNAYIESAALYVQFDAKELFHYILVCLRFNRAIDFNQFQSFVKRGQSPGIIHEFFGKMVLFKRQAENYVRYHPIDRINSENFGEYLVLMHCFLKEIEVLQEKDKAQYKMMSLVPIMKCDCQHLMLSETSFQNSNVEILQDRNWASQCFNIEGFEDIFTNTLYLDMYSVSFVNASRPGGQRANVQFINNDEFQRQAVAYMLEDQFDDQIQGEEDADDWQDEVYEILDLIDDQEEVDLQEAPLRRPQQQMQQHLNDPELAEGLPDRHEMVRFIGVDVGIRRALAACTMDSRLENAVKQLLDQPILNPDDASKYLVFFGAAGKHGFAQFGRMRHPPLVQFRSILSKYAIVKLTPENYSSKRCNRCPDFAIGIRHTRPRDHFICSFNLDHQTDGDKNASKNILYIGLYMILHEGQFPANFIVHRR
ncbi:hypothetical protein MIR68_000710 [Amoeboaphelidium protococcarum]|nr:hypothetical protein MIR68_000710 [Amoeboaphelidium protococcarum]